MKHLLKESVQKSDFIVWWATILFFVGSAMIMSWNILDSIKWALWIIWLMFAVWLSIELILNALKNIKWLGEITGYITNWPEALVLIVWLISGNILFAASTPLGSNVMNPILLLLAIIATSTFLVVKKFKYNSFFIFGFILTSILALWSYYILWLEDKLWENAKIYFLATMIISTIFTILLYIKNRKITKSEEIVEENDDEKAPIYFLPLWVILLLVSGFFLDPVVSFTAEASKAPKWIIWFLVLSTLTSWPEFKSCFSLLRKNKVLDAFVNILVSNFTNIWLATVWVLVYIFMK